jgi:AcrR family transcriptional regulator
LLFTDGGVKNVGINQILDKARCAKASLYDNFGSKAKLALAVLAHREQVWTRDWLEHEIKSRNADPVDRLLSIFDIYDDWLRHPKFKGCLFIKVLLEPKWDSKVQVAASDQLKNIRDIIAELAKDAELSNPERFAQVWQLLMHGAIVDASVGNRDAGQSAKLAAQATMDSWPRRKSRR